MEQWEERHQEWERQYEQKLKLLGVMIARDPIGARWGFSSEQTFHDVSRSIFEELSGLEMVSVIEFDAKGEVFGRPDQIELDVIIQNGMLILCEIKSSISRSDMYTFDRKVTFYEKRHGRKATRKLVISPMVDARTLALADELGIEVYNYVEDVTL